MAKPKSQVAAFVFLDQNRNYASPGSFSYAGGSSFESAFVRLYDFPKDIVIVRITAFDLAIFMKPLSPEVSHNINDAWNNGSAKNPQWIINPWDTAEFAFQLKASTKGRFGSYILKIKDPNARKCTLTVSNAYTG